MTCEICRTPLAKAPRCRTFPTCHARCVERAVEEARDEAQEAAEASR